MGSRRATRHNRAAIMHALRNLRNSYVFAKGMLLLIVFAGGCSETTPSNDTGTGSLEIQLLGLPPTITEVVATVTVGGQTLEATATPSQRLFFQEVPSGTAQVIVGTKTSASTTVTEQQSFQTIIRADRYHVVNVDFQYRGPNDPPPDAGNAPRDGGNLPVNDAAIVDAGVPDTGLIDAGEPDTGVKPDAGVVITPVAFPYTPRNFDPVGGPTAMQDIQLNCNVSTFHSDTLAYENWCNQPQPVPEEITRDGENLVLLRMTGFTLASGSTLRIVGDRAVVLAVYGDAQVDGILDVGATGPVAGPGGNRATCNNASGTNGSGSDGDGGGGGGGAHGSDGGDGGDGASDGSTKGGKGSKNENFGIEPLIAGCPGGNGGFGSQPGGQGGGGGGGVQLSVAGNLQLLGIGDARGGGGLAGRSGAGGGGGGSGGSLIFEGNTLLVGSAAILVANGGSGGQGGTENSSAENGQDGQRNSAAASGGNMPSGGGDGGNGGAGTLEPTVGGTSGNDGVGGGGGGGGVGRIRLEGHTGCTVDVNAILSPNPFSNTGC